MTLLAADVREEKLAPVFSPSVLFPSEKPAQKNYEAWRGFWSQERLARLELNLNAAARENGFTADAFDPFWKMIHQNMPRTFEIPQKYFEMLGISATPEGYTQLTLLGAGKNYRAENLFGTISSAGIAKLFDADLFNKKMGEFLKSLFVEIALIVSLGLVVVISLFLFRLAFIIDSDRSCRVCSSGHPGHTENHRPSAGYSRNHALDCHYGDGD